MLCSPHLRCELLPSFIHSLLLLLLTEHLLCGCWVQAETSQSSLWAGQTGKAYLQCKVVVYSVRGKLGVPWETMGGVPSSSLQGDLEDETGHLRKSQGKSGAERAMCKSPGGERGDPGCSAGLSVEAAAIGLFGGVLPA